MRVPYHSIEYLLGLIDEPNRSACLCLYHDNKVLFCKVQGSTNNHQAWLGGYHDHIEEAMNIAVAVYAMLSARRPLPFSLSDLLLVVFFHDIEKPWKYELRSDGQLHHRPGMEEKADHQRFRMEKLREYGIVLTPMQENGIAYAEGEIHDYSPRERRMSPLAAAAHMCDVCSARIWHDRPLRKNDPWKHSSRKRSLRALVRRAHKFIHTVFDNRRT